MPRPFPQRQTPNTSELSRYCSPEPQLRPTGLEWQKALEECHGPICTKNRQRVPQQSPDKTETFMYRIPWVFRTCARCFIAKSSPAFKSLHYCSGAVNTHDSASPCRVLTRQGYSRATISQHPLQQPWHMTSQVVRRGEQKFTCNLPAVLRRGRMASPSYLGWISCHHLGPCVEDAGRGWEVR